VFAKIGRGDRVAGLMAYLVGPGRANEHAEPHLVAGDPALMAWHDDAELSHEAGLRIARHLDRPRRAYGVEVPGGHVWHCSLSLRAEEGQLTDQRWQEISEAFVERMGFGTHEDTKAPVRWIAVRHGVSTNGNDHVHLVVDLVREDGTKASIHNDRIRARDLCRELEREFDLEPLESAGRDRASVGFEYAEREAVGRRRARGMFEQRRRAGEERRTWSSLPAGERDALVRDATSADQPRWELARKVRACATASADEAEFVRRMRQHGVLVRPRFADGRTDVVTGYSVAARPVAGERPIWYGGGHLAKDLTLPRLRAEWPDTPHGAEAAAAEWSAAKRGRRPVASGREVQAPGPEVWEQVNRDLAALREGLRSVPIEDRDTWARVARQTAGAFAAWSTRVESPPGPLAAAADALARSAETVRAPRAKPVPLPSAAGAAYLMLAAMDGGPAAQLVVLKQLANLAKALHDMHQAEGAVRRARALEQTARRELVSVSTRLGELERAQAAQAIAQQQPEAAEALRRSRMGQAPASGAAGYGSPVPNPLPESRRQPSVPRGTPARPGAGRGQGQGGAPERGPER
jgi:hypothetical protein